MSKKKNRKKIFNQRNLNKFKVSLLKSANKSGALFNVKYSLPKSQYDNFNHWYKNESVYLSKNLNPIFPSDAKKLKYIIPNVEPELVNEFEWGWSFLGQFVDEISSFEEEVDQYEDAILLSDLDSATTALDKIEHLYGFSYWLLKNR
ncbi:hypothetical protein [uncultured Desulfosarcina sp.]|uniref:hypothetical protein n=1 Tax=uncultured Desulfosarcina sp. TaxID=218289 RepID=UPI0029C95CDC|nr:hypothetical protein [uncultured Desulfosarcina sp.]